MIVGGYQLDLYCRFSPVSLGADPDRPFDRRHYRMLAQFCGDSRRETMRAARAAGWKFYKGDVTCPECVKDPPARDPRR